MNNDEPTGIVMLDEPPQRETLTDISYALAAAIVCLVFVAGIFVGKFA